MRTHTYHWRKHRRILLRRTVGMLAERAKRLGRYGSRPKTSVYFASESGTGVGSAQRQAARQFVGGTYMAQ